MESVGEKRATIWLRLTPQARDALREFTRAQDGPTVAIVLDGRVLDPVSKLNGVFAPPEFAAPEMDIVGAKLLLPQFERAVG